MAHKATFILTDLNDSNNDNSIGFIEYKVKLHDADGVEVMYNITDYYNESNEIVDTRIWVLSDKILDDLFIENDSKLGKKILTFFTKNHPIRGDLLEAMFVAGRTDRLKRIDDSLDSFMRIKI